MHDRHVWRRPLYISDEASSGLAEALLDRWVLRGRLEAVWPMQDAAGVATAALARARGWKSLLRFRGY